MAPLSNIDGLGAHLLQARQSSIDRDGFYQYTPSKAAAGIFTVIFIASAIINIIQFFFYKAWFWWPMVLSILLEVFGYISRDSSISDTSKQNPYVAQTILLLVAPTVMAAACYQAFGRVVLWVTPPEYQSARYLWLPARRITPLFVGFDILSFFIQGAGGGVLASADDPDNITMGKNILLAGLGLQLACFGFFVLASLRFSLVLKTKLKHVTLPSDTNWPLFLAVINFASFLILIRTIFRLVEYVLGARNYLSSHEAFFYCLDAVPILLVVLAFTFVHPGLYLPYIGIRRKTLEFSRNYRKGIFSNFARAGQKAGKPVDVELTPRYDPQYR